MAYNILSQGKKHLIKQRSQKRWRRVVGFLAAIVVFVTTYALVLPAITMERDVICGMEEHTHTAECYTEQQTLTCHLNEEPGHEHTDACFDIKTTLICDQEEGEEHSHSEECYVTDRTLICGQEEYEGHIHTDECYKAEQVLSCGHEEHIHNEDCYAKQPGDPTADVESRSDWERTVENVTLSGDWAKDLVAIAESQLGYTESTKNFVVTESGDEKGYTRYGAWYGNSYGHWSAMFVSFSLHYAGIPQEAIPYAAGCQKWIDELKQLELYKDAADYTPEPGDIIFFDYDGNGESDHVGIVARIEADETAEKPIITIEGNKSSRVKYDDYKRDNTAIMGYGSLKLARERYDLLYNQSQDDIELTATTPEGVTITLTGSSTSFPAPVEELSLTATELFSTSSEEVERAATALQSMDAALQEAGMTSDETRLFDIRLFKGDQEIEPVGPVSLTFSGIKNVEVSGGAKVYHIDEAQDMATDMPAALNGDGGIVVETDHFSLYGVALLAEVTPFAAGTITANLAVKSATWDSAQKQITTLSFEVSSTTNKWAYTLQHSADGGTTWSPPNPTTTAIGTKANANNQVITLTADSTMLNSLTINSVFRVYGFKSTQVGEYGYTADLTLPQILDKAKAGFSDWLQNNYMQDFGGTEPIDITGLYSAFNMYYAQPVATLSPTQSSGAVWLSVAVNPAAAYTYRWEYQDENGDWQTLTENTAASINVTELRSLLAGGKQVRAKVYDTDNNLVAISNQLAADPYAAAVSAINAELGLTTYNIGKGKTADLSIGGHRFNDLFYYGNMARDSGVPFSDAESYRTYLAETYLTEGINAVRSEWNYYLWDLYDPSYDYGNSNGGSGSGLYPEAGGYGDSTFEWPKDAGGTNSSPFHASVSPTIEPLNYSFLENGIDYSNFVTGLHKTATAVAAGDANSERRYDIDIVADAQAKVKAPVVLVFQIQTSWQMFDMLHANRLGTDLPKNGTAVGTNSINSELANLYDIKQALLRLIDYMEANNLGNNLAIAITDVEHAGTFSMFTGTDSAGKAMYVTNNLAKLREAIIGWDTFGNCEHVHYSATMLQNAVNNLSSNLSTWKDIYGENLPYDSVQKAAIIIGGPTENSNGTSGYGITLPWATFQGAKLNSVYSIRTNVGTPVTAGAPISWIDYLGNNTGTTFKNGVGTKFTDKYVASNEDALFYALLDIVNREMNTKGLNVTDGGGYVDHVAVSDTVEKEFFLNKGADITATIQDADGNVVSTKTLTLVGAQIDRQSDGTVVTTTVDGLVITERPDKTTTLEYDFGQVYNTQKAVLHFQVEAREDYIGSNTVFANVGTPALDYTHIKKDSGGNPTGETDIYPVTTKDTPQVNVPIRFDTVDGEAVTIMVGESVNLKDLSEAIALDAQDRVDNYPQTNGTLSYVWVLPNGTEVPAGSVTVIDGTVNTEFPDRSSNFTGTVAGMYTGTLKVTFTPLPVDSANTNFSDTATKTAVNPLTKPGNVWINVITGESTTDLLVRKEWADGPPAGVTAVDFLLLADGVPIQENGIDRLFNLSKENSWELLIENLPMVRDNAVIAYTVQETPVSDTYRATYDSDIIMEPVYKARVKLTVTPNENVNANQSLTIVYTYGGQTYTYFVAADTHAQYPSGTAQTFTVDNLPLDENGNPMAVAITEVRRNNHLKPNYTRSATSEIYISTYVSHPVWIITNTPAFTLPETGGAGTIPYTMAGVLLLLCAGLMYKKKSFRKGGCKFR